MALANGKHVGFLYLMPSEIAPWGPVGRDLMVIQCLTIIDEAKHKGVGRSLVAAAEEETHRQRRKSLAAIGFYHDFWFMPATFFERCGFTVARRMGKSAILWKTLKRG